MPETPTAPDIVLAHLDNLPPLPPVVLKLLHVTADPQATATDVVQLLRGDQSLAAKVLSLAGSAALGVGTPAKTLEQAVPRLGFAAVRNIVLAATVFECFSGSPTADRPGSFDRRELWKHALAVACAARRLASTGGQQNNRQQQEIGLHQFKTSESALRRPAASSSMVAAIR